MKKLLLLVSLLTLCQYASAVEMEDLVGTYKVTHPKVPFVTMVTIDGDGMVSLLQSTAFGKLNCKGQGTIEDNVLSSRVRCSNHLKFTQNVTLDKEVKGLKNFQALVYSSLYHASLEMNFERQ